MSCREDAISRKYAINQIEMAMGEVTDCETREQLSRFKDFLHALPSQQELEEHVYCTECEHLTLSEEMLDCPYSSICHFWNPEDSAPRHDRCCYAPKGR